MNCVPPTKDNPWKTNCGTLGVFECLRRLFTASLAKRWHRGSTVHTHTHIYWYIHIINIYIYYYHLSIDLSIDRSIYLPVNICFDYLCSQPGASPDPQTFDFNKKSQNLRVHSTWLNKPLVDVDVFYRCEMVPQHRWSTAGLYCGKPGRKGMWYLEHVRTNYWKNRMCFIRFTGWFDRFIWNYIVCLQSGMDYDHYLR